MEKPAKSKKNILKFLPRAASAFNFQQNPPFSPGREKHKVNVAGRGFSGPIVSLVPAEARKKTKNESFDAQEPTSPKVSCIGQIKSRKKKSKKINKSKRVSVVVSPPQEQLPKWVSSPQPGEVKKKQSRIHRIFGRKSHAPEDNTPPVPDGVPSLSQMRRFASGRDVLADFDWLSVASEDRNHDSDEEREESDVEGEVIIPHSAPILVGGGGAVASEKSKEVNLWKRRTAAPPKPQPLQVGNSHGAKLTN